MTSAPKVRADQQQGSERDVVAEEGSKQQGAEKRHITLRSLGPEFNEEHHGVYVRHLEEAVQDTRNRNIALTGRYGVGKSSVLDAFEEKHSESTIRISVNTLGPDEDGTDLTNRIQKELVKQFVYRIAPGKIRSSRFARPNLLTKFRALRQAFATTIVGLGVLWLFGVRPMANWPGAGANTAVQASLVALFFVLVLLAVWAIRWVIGDRIVSEVSTAGTKIALGEGPTTYFDSFLDEIVTFFDAVEPEFVIFEDLDRFDDPQIFDSLRELNTLINTSARWRDKNRPLRFIYAIKDSLFEQLGAESKTGASVDESAKCRVDVATAAVRRANRTKFFEIVIPIVPFISYRNARDHIVETLTALGFGKGFVSRPLLDLVARYTTDMRLMINICNEFAVFVERLLWADTPAPDMNADHLFALVVYKNFHLADFEAISQRESTLDELERCHRDEVRALIVDLQDKRSRLLRLEEHREDRERTAAELGARLHDIIETFWSTTVSIEVGNKNFSVDDIDSVEFWQFVAKKKFFKAWELYSSKVVEVGAKSIVRLFPEAVNEAEWSDPEPAELAQQANQCDRDIAMLRGADFAELARYERASEKRNRFDQCIDDVLKSELARELVRGGFITRNYAEYSAIFYGSFVGVDVAFFYNRAVQSNKMYLDYEFISENAMSNLLEQVPKDFTSSVSALNIQIVSYLLEDKSRIDEAKSIVAYIVTHNDADVQTFLNAFFNEPDAPREDLVRMLTKHPWREVFEYLASHPGIPDHKTRLRLFDTALLSAEPISSYKIGDRTKVLIESYYSYLAAVTEDHACENTTSRIFEMLEVIGITVNDLEVLNAHLRDRIVNARMYDINVKNLCLALDIDGVPTLDEVHAKTIVWELCRNHIMDYVSVMENDLLGQPIILRDVTLIKIIEEQCDVWASDQLRDIIARSAPSAAIVSIEDTPPQTWSIIVDSRRMVPTAANILAYVKLHGVDKGLSTLLIGDRGEPVELQNIQEVSGEDRNALAVQLLNASEYLSANSRVRLVGQLSLESEIEPTSVIPSPNLLAQALKTGLLPDTFESFAHFATGGWESVSDAFAVSKKISEFMRPALVEDFVVEFLEDQEIPCALRRIVVENLGEYVPNDDKQALEAAGQFALEHEIWLPLEDIRRIARVTQNSNVIPKQLAHAENVSADDLFVILTSLGRPYDKMLEGSGVEFHLPASAHNVKLVERLQSAGRIEIIQEPVGKNMQIRTL